MKRIKIYIIILIGIISIGCTYEEETDNIKTNTTSLGLLTYKIPKSFKKSDNSTITSYFYDYIDEINTNSCTLSVILLDEYTSNLEQIIKTYMYSNDDFIIKEKTINKIKWKYAKNERNSDKIYYVYTTIFNNKIYVVQYDDLKTGDYCDYAYKKIIKSLKFQE